ncbi:MAG: flagellar basal body-associated FliL family protein [Pseudomonadota bacterium]
MAVKEDDEKKENSEENSEEILKKIAATKKKKKKKIIIISATILLLIAVGFGLYKAGIIFPEKKDETKTKKGKKKKAEGEEAARGTTGSSTKSVKQNLNEWTPGLVPGHETDEVIYYNLPEFLVNLNTNGKQTSFIKMKATLEVAEEGDVEAVESRIPRIIDNFNTYIRELRTGDIAGSAGLYRLREELLLRVNKTIYPNKVNDILFREIIIH